MSSKKESSQKAINANNYNHKGVVVLKFETRHEENGDMQTYATGFDLDNPDELLSIRLMSEEGYKKQIAQFRFGLTEKKQNGETYFLNRKTNERLTVGQYQDFVESDPDMKRAFSNLIKSRRDAESIATKQSRVDPNKPVVLMFDGANKLGDIEGISLNHNGKQIDKIAMYEARWINGIAGNSSLSANKEAESDFSLCHRKILGNINIKYNEANQPIWGDCNAIDRIKDFKIPPDPSHPEFKTQSSFNIALLRYALSNRVKTSEGYEAEKKPFTYFNILDKSNAVKETIALLTEEYADTRRKQGDSIVKFEFQRPHDGPRTLEAYMVGQDTLSMPLQLAIQDNTTITEGLIKNAVKSDKVRAVVGSLAGFTPDFLVTPELAERVDNADLKRRIVISSNEVKKLHNSLVNGELNVRMINGTTYPIGPKYLERFVSDVLRNSEGDSPSMRKPISAVVNITTINNQKIIRSYDENRNLTFSPMYICPKKWHENTEDKTSSVFTSLITVPAQSYQQAVNERLTHIDLNESHNPSLTDFKLINQEYAAYFGAEKINLPSISKLLEDEKERVEKISDAKKFIEANNIYCRLLGNTHPVEVPETKQPTTQQENQKDKSFEF